MGAAYLFGRTDISLPALKQLAEEHADWQFVVRPRYGPKTLKRHLAGSIDYTNIKIFTAPIDLQSLLAKADLLLGGGATMCLEAAYYGTPVITCRPIASPITNWLERAGLAWKGKTVESTIALAEDHIRYRTTETARKAYSGMQFPLKSLIRNIERKTTSEHAKFSNHTMQFLETIRQRDGHKSIDSVIRYLGREAGEI